jgi:ubiquitin-like 1-activating enzyme E1 B
MYYAATAKVYPICTIRSTPDKPVHCIVWAKELFKLLLGPTAESMLFESAISPEDEDKASTSSSSANYSETSEYMKFVNFPDVQDTGSLQEYTKSLFTALFHTEVSKQIEAGVYKTSKKTPQPLDTSIIDSMCASYSTLLDTTTNTSSGTRIVYNSLVRRFCFVNCCCHHCASVTSIKREELGAPCMEH